jgi:hypothetical protein
MNGKAFLPLCFVPFTSHPLIVVTEKYKSKFAEGGRSVPESS